MGSWGSVAHMTPPTAGRTIASVRCSRTGRRPAASSCPRWDELAEELRSAGRGGRRPARRRSRPRDRAQRRLRSRGRRAGHLRQRRPRGGHHGRAPAVPAGGQPLRPPDRRAGGRPREAHRARGPPRKGAHGQRESAARDLDRAPVPGQRAHPARSDPGGDPGPDPGDREVRLAAGLQVLDLRDLVDPPGGRARHRERGAHDQAPRIRRRAREEDRSRAAAAGHGSSAASRPRKRSRRGAEIPLDAGARHAGGGADRHEPRQAARRPGGDLARRHAARATTASPPRRSS